MSTVLRVGLIGCGRLAAAGYVPAFAAAHGVQLVAVADPEPSRRDVVAAAVAGAGDRPATAHPGARELLAAEPVDAVVLATPARAHLADAILATDAGVAVMVEKPPAPDAATAAALAALRPAPWVGFNRRFDPGARAVRDRLPTEGPVRLRLALSYRRRSWGAHTVRDDVLLDLGPHLVDWARWLGGEALQVRAAQAAPARARLEVTTTRGTASLTAATDRIHTELVEARDPAGRLLGHHRAGGIAAAVWGRLRPTAVHPLVASLTAQLDAFARAVRTGDPGDLATATDGAAAMAAIDAARASADRGGAPVEVVVPAGA